MIESPSLWCAPQFFAAAPDKVATVDVWPIAAFSGAVIVDSGSKRPTEVTLLFTRSNSADDLPERGEVTCPIDDAGHFSCAMPAGTFDMRLRARRYISRFYWKIKMEAAAKHDAGVVGLKEGQSVFGHIEAPKGKKLEIGQSVVRASLAAAGDERSPLVAGGQMLAVTGTVHRNGTFQIDGLPPGEYIVQAAHPAGLVAPPVVVIVHAGNEVELLDALVLDRLHQLSMSISPPTAPDGGTWQVTVGRYVNETHLETLFSEACSPAGTFEHASIYPGTYELRISTSDGSTWHRETREIHADTRINLQLSSLEVRGTVAMGGKPLQAKLAFSDKRGRKALTVADLEGRFVLHLPGDSGTDWDVTVQSEKPAVHKTVRKVEIRVESEIPTVEVVVPSLLVMGNVYDASGAPVPSAIINIGQPNGPDGLIQGFTAADGSFAIHGLDAGSYTASAAYRDKQSSSTPFEVKEGDLPEPLRLVLKDVNQIRGIIVSDLGPVAGAAVNAFATDLGAATSSPSISDAEGRFEAWLPPESREFDIFVAAPGYAYMIDHVVFQANKLLRVTLYRRGGTISLPNSPMLQIVHGGGIVSIGELARDWFSRVDRSSAEAPRLVFDMLEPGGYSVCNVSPQNFPQFRRTNGATGGRCTSAFLPPYGTVSVDVTDRP